MVNEFKVRNMKANRANLLRYRDTAALQQR